MRITYSVSFILCCIFAASCHTGKPLASVPLRSVNSADAPRPLGPYSHAVVSGNMVYCSGQLGNLPPIGKAFAGMDITTQTNQALKNLTAVLKEAGTDMAHVVKVTVYLKDMNDYPTFNNVYKDYFPTLLPARAAIQAERLPKDALIEIDCIAELPGK